MQREALIDTLCLEQDYPEGRDESCENGETSKGQCSTLHKRRMENTALTNAVVASNKSLTESEKLGLVQREDDECDIFGKLVAKRMRTIKNGVIRMLAEQEILNVILSKICEDEGVILRKHSNK